MNPLWIAAAVPLVSLIVAIVAGKAIDIGMSHDEQVGKR